MQVKDILIKDYVKSKSRLSYDIWIDKVKPRNQLNGVELSLDGLTFNEMTMLKKLLSGDDDTYHELIVKLFLDVDFENIYFFDYIAFRKWIIEEVVKISENEAALFDIDADMVKAGADILNKYAELNIKIEIAEQFGKSPQEIGDWNYFQVMQIIAYNSDRNKVRKNLMKK